MLTIGEYVRVEQWIYRNARPLDLARWRYHFEGGASEEVVKAMEAYQNEDGGFGHGLEADCWNPHSSAMQTWWAIQLLREIELPKGHPLIDRILCYLSSGHNFVQRRWLNTVPENNAYPGAPWWLYSEESLGNRSYNPTVALAGFILKYEDTDTALYELAISLVKEAAEFLVVSDALIEMHELACFGELAEYLRELSMENLVDYEAYCQKLNHQVFETIEHDSSQWTSAYCCRPSHFVRSPESLFYAKNKKAVHEELDLITTSMNDEGVWDVTWQWGSYDKEFAISARWWQSNIVIQNIRMLNAFDRLND